VRRRRQTLAPKQTAKDATRSIDKTFFLVTILLTILGLFSVANTSAPLAASVFKDPFFFVKQQIMWAGLGIVLMIVAASVPLSLIKRFARPVFFVSVILLVLVLVPGFGSRLLGARRWLVLGPVSFQPSEVIKTALAIFFADLASRGAPLKQYVWTLALVGALVMLQPDLGTTITIVSIAFTQIFVIGFSFVQMGVIAGSGILAGIVLILTSEYRRARLFTFLSPHNDPSGVDYHVRQIMIALGSGGFWGRGLGQSRQKQLFLPETATDSVFAVIAEEMGFIGAFAIILILAFFVLRALKIAQSAPDTFSRILAVGLVGWMAAQIFFNISSMVALTPLTGIPLPFFSYGGSSLTMLLASVGILLNISKYEPKT